MLDPDGRHHSFNRSTGRSSMRSSFDPAIDLGVATEGSGAARRERILRPRRRFRLLSFSVDMLLSR
jgi:hypothetical protein